MVTLCKLKDLLEAEGQIVAAFFLAAHSRRGLEWMSRVTGVM